MSDPTTPRHDDSQACTALKSIWNLSFTPQTPHHPAPKLPLTSPSRLADPSAKTFLYLAYGSNLSAETFKGARGIKPLSSTPVHVPTLSLTFDLPGLPYQEPCFANTSYRKPPPFPPFPPSSFADEKGPSTEKDKYRKDRWHKGLIGVVYEVTPEDYITIIATEGGGASYQDVLVPCFILPPGLASVPAMPSGVPFAAHTLFCPPTSRSRPDPSYAQPSARYLKLITDGAAENRLPADYRAWLFSLRPYERTRSRQEVGRALLLGFWGPVIVVVFGLTKIFADEDGRVPSWLVVVLNAVFAGVWRSYDLGFKRVCGDGERTEGLVDGDDPENEIGGREKGGMIRLDV
jgi:hypothetical protein